MPADQPDRSRSRAAAMVVAAAVAWVAYRVARRALRLAAVAGVLAAVAAVANSRGVDLGAVKRLVSCEAAVLARSAAQLPGLLAQGPPGTRHRALPIAADPAGCGAPIKPALAARPRPGARP